MEDKHKIIAELFEIYKKIKPVIEGRLSELLYTGNKGSDEDILSELCFCILTPQSKAQLCWEAVSNLRKKKSY